MIAVPIPARRLLPMSLLSLAATVLLMLSGIACGGTAAPAGDAGSAPGGGYSGARPAGGRRQRRRYGDSGRHRRSGGHRGYGLRGGGD